jgi:replicative DNA helicase
MLDLNQCNSDCLNCIKWYKKKHSLRKGQGFDIKCIGIPDEYVNEDFSVADKQSARMILDPVIWAAETLDWHCLDPDGEIWKRKNPGEYYAWKEENPGQDILGHSRYHRPYQAEMLRCTAKRKVFRIGRQVGKTECLVISILYNLFLKPGVPEDEGFKVIIITPYQSQIDLIFTRLKQLIRGSSDAQNSIRRDVKAPIYTLELHNESIARGFTAGTKSGGNAESVRGQAGHMLVFDEADYLSTGDMDAAMSIITNYPQATLWMSSTPQGKREQFYKTCKSTLYKEFHFTSEINPMWSMHQDKTFRENMTEIGYKHEVLADFGEQQEGVFQNVYVQAAKANYKYGELRYQHTWEYSIGVDWNDTANGTTINVLGFDPARTKFIIVDRKVVSREGWTQTAAMQKIAELNRIWKPIAIYIDSGHGGTQWEMLRKFGYDSLLNPSKGPTHPDARLRNIVKKYDFGSKVETRDPFTKQKIQKPAKPFLVESTVRRFETNDILFPESDTALEDQLLGYIIDRVTQSGTPVYKANNETAGDHALDALMLSVIAFVMEVTPLGRPKFDIGIAFSGQFGEKLGTEIHEGDTVVYGKRPQELHKEQRNRSKPDMGRDKLRDDGLIKSGHELPANHIHNQKQVGLWSWPGFMRDEPKPRVRSLSEAENDARKRIGLAPHRGSRPRRKHI